MKVCGEQVSRDDALAIAHSAHKDSGEAVIMKTDKATANGIVSELELYGLSVSAVPTRGL